MQIHDYTSTNINCDTLLFSFSTIQTNEERTLPLLRRRALMGRQSISPKEKTTQQAVSLTRRLHNHPRAKNKVCYVENKKQKKVQQMGDGWSCTGCQVGKCEMVIFGFLLTLHACLFGRRTAGCVRCSVVSDG